MPPKTQGAHEAPMAGAKTMRQGRLRRAEEPFRGRRPRRTYRVYGLCLRSDWSLPCPEGRGSDRAEVELFDARSSLFSEAMQGVASQPGGEDWFQHRRLWDGSDYLRWSGLFEFLVSPDGRRIACHPLNGTSREAFHAYLLGQVISFALLRQGNEPLHSTAMLINGEAVGFVGDCGYGKSSLGAAFLQAGYPLLTDDLLVVKEEGHGFFAYPGPPRIKLFPGIAKSLLGEWIAGTPMNNLTPKLVIPLGLDGKMFCREASPLKAIYVLTPPSENSGSERITIRTVSPRRACLELLKNTFNAVVVEPARLRRQFDLAARLASRIPVKSLSFPRRLARLAAVREAILSDVIA